jgi:hypothetical protein
MATDLNRTFSKEEIQMTKKIAMKNCSPTLDIKEMKINTILKFYLISVRIAIIKNITKNVLVRMWGKRNPHTLLVEMQASTTTLEKNMEAS